LNIIIISHESDVDGVFSAAIALQRYPQGRVFFTSYGKENFNRVFDLVYGEVLKSTSKGVVIFTDLGLSEELVEITSELFSFLHSNSWEVLWIDHHPWPLKSIELFNSEKETSRLVLDSSGKKCAAELTYDYMLPDNNKAKLLASIAHTSDFLLNDQIYPPLPELIIYYKNIPNFYSKLTELAIKVSNGVLWDLTMQQEYLQYCKYRDESKSESIKKMQVVELSNGMKMAVIPSSPYIQASLFSEEIFRESSIDAIFFLSDEGKVSIRRNNPNIKCNKIASNLLEGGGHEYAAGGHIKSEPSKMHMVIMELKNALEKSLTKK
jgi:oligoribonuclease NrnB/cAMP/cGMP phosphodiesterase (DHH superfamily)